MKDTRGSLIMSLIATLMVISLIANVTSAWYVDSEDVSAQFTSGIFDVKLKIGEENTEDQTVKSLSFTQVRPMEETTFYQELKTISVVKEGEGLFQRLTITNNGTLPARYVIALEEGEIPTDRDGKTETLSLRPSSPNGVCQAEDEQTSLECHNDLQKVLQVRLFDGSKEPVLAESHGSAGEQVQSVDLMVAPYVPQDVLKVGETRIYYLGGYLPADTPPYRAYTDQDGTTQYDMYNGGHYHAKLVVNAWQQDMPDPQLPKAPDSDRFLRSLAEDNDACPLGGEASHIIYTAEDLSNVRNHLDCNFVLANDIDLSKSAYAQSWTPLGAPETEPDQGEYVPYTGAFDGNGHTISGLLVNGEVHTDANGEIIYSEPYGGLFSKIEGGTVKNLNVEGTVTSGSISGLLTGYNNGTIANCSVSGAVQAAADDSGIWRLGGITGLNGENGIIENSRALCEVFTKGQWAGGLVGENLGVIRNCYSGGNVSGAYAGGIAGRSEGSVDHCYTVAQVHVSDSAAGHPTIGEAPEEVQIDDQTIFFEKTHFYVNDQLSAAWEEDSSRGCGKTADELQLAATYNGWNTAVWNLADGEYPTLQSVS